MLYLLVILLCLVNASQLPLRSERKQLAGPPSDFASQAFPTPLAQALRADSSVLPVELTTNRNNQYEWKGEFPVDSLREFAVSVVTTMFDDLQIFMQPPNFDREVQLTDDMFNKPDSLGKLTRGPFGIDGLQAPATTYTFPDPELGTWKLRIVSSRLNPFNAKYPVAYLLLDNRSDMKLLSHLSSYNLELDETVGVVVQLYDESSPAAVASARPRALTAADGVTITSAELHVVLPNDQSLVLPMRDDGLHNDLASNDGIYGASLTAAYNGTYLTRAVLKGSLSDGRQFMRTTQHIFPVTNPSLSLTGLSDLVEDTETLSFYLHVDVARDLAALKKDNDAHCVRAYAQVWGSPATPTNASRLLGQDPMVPVAWMQAMVDAEVRSDGSHAVRLDINKKWAALAGAQAPFQLRDVRLLSRDYSTPLSMRAQVFVQQSAPLASLPTRESLKFPFVVTEEMTSGPRPVSHMRSSAAVGGGSGKLMLVHGYCSGQVWTASDFTNAVEFQDYHVSLTQDQFALKLRKFGEALGSCGAVAHSQGGMATLHLKAFYWSCLDLGEGERLVQTVGSPFHGCSMAGTVADLGVIFGIGCGQNFDLTPDGAELWVNTVPRDAQGSVYYYTTQYSDDWWIFSDCVTASNLILYRPNDGTCEVKFASLEGGHAVGHQKGWCHTSGMKEPSQTTDAAHNKLMDGKAAR